MSWSCLGEREGRCREEEVGGVRLESHTRGTTGKGAVSYWAVYASLFVFTGSLHAPVSLSFQLVVYQCCHVHSSCSSQQERSRTGPGRLTITKTQSKGIVFGEFLPPSWDERNLRDKLALLEWRTDNKQTGVEKGKTLTHNWSNFMLFCSNQNQKFLIPVSLTITDFWKVWRSIAYIQYFHTMSCLSLCVWMRVHKSVGGSVLCLLNFMMCCLDCASSLEQAQLSCFFFMIICSDLSHVQK